LLFFLLLMLFFIRSVCHQVSNQADKLALQTWERLWKRILEKHRIWAIFKLIIKLCTVLASGKDAFPASKRRGVVYEIPCGNCGHRYIGEAKQSLSNRLKEHHRDALPWNILKNPEKTELTKHAAQSGNAFNWDYAHVLHHVNGYHKWIFLESLYIILKTNTVNDKSANFPAIYFSVLKHERSLSVTGLPWVCILIDRLFSCL